MVFVSSEWVLASISLSAFPSLRQRIAGHLTSHEPLATRHAAKSRAMLDGVGAGCYNAARIRFEPLRSVLTEWASKLTSRRCAS